MPAPMSPSAGGTEAHRAPPLSLGTKDVSLPALRLGSTDCGATDPMTPVVLSETERRFRFHGLPRAVGAARRSLREWESHFEPDLFYDLSLCVSELVTNRVQRGEPADGNEIELAVRRSGTLVRAEISERRRDAVVTRPTAMARTDWGMFIVDLVADRWGVDRSAGTLVWCEIDLASDGRSRSASEG
jgi:anti-sigma regulatory factor (Ser/Thr protein kinase)